MALGVLFAAATPAQSTPAQSTPGEASSPGVSAASEGSGEASNRSTWVTRKRTNRGPSDYTIEPQPFSVHPVAGATAADTLKLVPGVFLSQHAGQGKAPQMFLRGFDAEHGQDIEVNVAGLPINEASNIHGQGYADATFVPSELVQLLRAKEGTADPRQGDFAVAGSIAFDLGLANEGATCSASAGTFGLLRTFVGFRPPGQDARTFAGAELVRSDGFGPHRAFERGSGVSQAVVDIAPRLQLRTFVASSFARFSSAGVVRLDDLAAGRMTRLASYEPGQGGASQRHAGLMELTWQGDSARTTTTAFATTRMLSLRHNFTGMLLFDAGDTVAQRSASTTVGWSGEYDRKLTWLGASQHLVVGLQLRGDDVASDQRRLSPEGIAHTQEVDAQLRLGHAGVYGEAVLRLLPQTTLRLGGRAEGVSFQIRDALGDATERNAVGFFAGPRLSAEWRPWPFVAVLAAYGEGFRTPQALALSRGEAPPITRVRNGELGLRGALAGQTRQVLEVAVTGFVSQVEQDRVFDHASATSLWIGPTLRTGVTTWVHAQWTTWLTMMLSATWVKAIRLTDASDVPFAPPLVARFDMRMQQPLLRFPTATIEGFANLGIGAVAARPLPYGDWAKPLALVDGAVGASVWGLTLSLEGYNWLDAQVNDGEFVYASRFSVADSAVPTRHVTVAAPRLMQGSFTWNF